MLKMRKPTPTIGKGYIRRLQESRTFKGISLMLAMSFLVEIIHPTVSLALTEGPSQPEVQSFEPIGTTQMVDLFTGDFNYNIPLFNLPGPNGGYPVNLAYHAGVSMDDEASWVGLGWNINPGALVRNMRGLPDEFKSIQQTSNGEYSDGEKYKKGDARRNYDFIRTKNDQKESWTLGLGLSSKAEFFGADFFKSLGNISSSIYFNNYSGVGLNLGVNPKLGSTGSTNFSLGLSLDSENGLGISPSLAIERSKTIKSRNRFTLSLSFDGDLSLRYDYDRDIVYKDGKRYKSSTISSGNGIGASLSYARSNFTPSIGFEKTEFNLSFGLTMGKSKLPTFFVGKLMNISFNHQNLNSAMRDGKYRPVLGYSKEGEVFNTGFTKDFDRINDGQITNNTPLLGHSYYSYDSYMSSGQGLSGYFRGRRNDVGKVHDPFLRNESFGIGVSIEFEKDGDTTFVEAPVGQDILEGLLNSSEEVEGTSNHWGAGFDINFGWSTQQDWDQHNQKKLDFLNPNPAGIKENLYYQAHGEHTILHPNALDHIDNFSLALMQFSEAQGLKNKPQKRILASENDHIQDERQVNARDRVVRNTLIHSLSNLEVGNLGEFKIKHYVYDFNSDLDLYPAPTVPLNRVSRKTRIKEYNDSNSGVNGFEEENVNVQGHNAGFKVLNEDGSYYVYGLPAYNKKQVQNLFSVGNYPAGFIPENTDLVDVDVFAASDEKEVEYKISGTHKFIDKTLTSPFAHSYMLTSVQGADYVDIENDGITDDDLGYWVKFDYVKYADDYKWRAPYTGANYSNGASYTRQDDKASYQYGEKELWYVGRMETKSHIAIFEMSPRKDMLEANGEFANVPDVAGKTGLKIDKIKVYEKKSLQSVQNDGDPLTTVDDVVPLQTVHFEYDYSLCKNVPNNNGETAVYPEVANQGGKLTLKKVWFTSVDSQRGKLNPYKFDYTLVDVDLPNGDEFEEGGVHDLVNPDYQRNSYDPWGSYRPYMDYLFLGNEIPDPNNPNDLQPQFLAGYGNHSNFPYTNQSSQGWKQKWMSSQYLSSEETIANEKITKTTNGLLASTWSLRKISLPSGGEINIEYESDDYSHVQHKTANQLFRVVKFGDFSSPNELYNGDSSEDFYDEDSSEDENRRRIYFKLEKPIPDSVYNNLDMAKLIYGQYVDPMIEDEKGDKNLYFKSRMRLTYNANNEVYDYVRGYLPLEKELENNQGSSTTYNYGVLADATLAANSDLTHLVDYDGSGPHYTIGYVTVQATQKKKKGNFFKKFHPMALSAWTYMQTNAQELLNPASGFNSNGTTPTSTGDVLGYFSNILNAIPATAQAFGFIRNYCKDKNFARFVDLQNTGIRLASPDKIKYGGGHRVKQISITDNWSEDAPDGTTNTYGQVYDYTTTEVDENGDERIISSGVAQYEPQAGGDENALKYPIHFVGRDKTFTSNNLFAEGPVNEALFPGAMVGYRKVSVRTLNTSKQLKAVEESQDVTAGNGRTGGVTEHEFYTCKDFPTRIAYSELHPENNTKAVLNLPIPIPFIGSIKRNFYHGSQAFKIELNDMHGKPKSVKSYEINDYSINSAPLTEMSYEYQTTPITYQGESVLAVNSSVKIIPNDGSHEANQTRLMGVETDLFTDQRENKSFWSSVGLDFNVDLPSFFPAGFPSVWPSYSNHKTLFRTYVTNKVIHRAGILKKTKSRDLQTVNETEILAYDEKAGTPLLTKVKNEFGDNFFSYNIPAYYHYDRMGHAYQNINYTFVTQVPELSSGNIEKRKVSIEVPIFGSMVEDLVRGDELLIIEGSTNNLYKKAYFLGLTYNGGNTFAKIQIINPSNEGTAAYKFKVIRSGRRNHYGTMAANYLTKQELASGTSQGVGGHAVSVPVIDTDVLSATASLFKDDWTTTSSEDLLYDGTTDNPFLTGNSGIFRPYKSYTYVGPREGAASMDDNSIQDPKLYDDGVMNNVPMFSWEIGDYEDYIPNWEWVNEVTRFSPDAYELENVNRLGIYSSALYGYDNSLTIAVGGNASVHELGTFDFEVTSGVGKLLGQTNMNFVDAQFNGTAMMAEQFNIKEAVMGSSNTLTITTDIPFAGFNIADFETNVGLSLISEAGLAPISNEGFYFNAVRNSSVSSVNYQGNDVVQFTVEPNFDGPTLNSSDLLVQGSTYHGKISMLKSRDYVSSTGSFEYSTEKAHTGVKSLKTSSTSTFDQPQLKMIAGKKYVFSAWVSRENIDVPTYEDDQNPLVVLSGTQGITVSKTTYSKIIEGWQKIDIEFESSSSSEMLNIAFVPGSSPMYVDDIRFSPRTGGITTYVYDPSRFWLRASLNVDNYATLFFYDEEGNLTIKKQETEEGIYTITESRGHVSEE